MKFIILASCFAALCAANSVRVSEDTAGNYKFDFDTEEYKRNEERRLDGATKGRFYYVDTEGLRHEVSFRSGADLGFLAESADIPVPVPLEPENPEVVRARNEHLAAWHEAVAKYGLFEEDKLTRHNLGGPALRTGQKIRVMVPVVEYVPA